MLPQVDWNSPREMGRNPPFFPVGTQWETRGKNRQQGLGKKGFPQKKVLSLVLCVAMLLSVMVMGTGAASFTDQDEFSDNYAEAAEVLTGMGIIQGYDDGSFLPQRNINRAQVATMIYRAATGDVTDSKISQFVGEDLFDDVNADDWFAGYVNYCGNAEYIKGFTPDTFGPYKQVTGYQVLAMILRAVGYDENDEYTGDQWTLRVAATAREQGLLDNLNPDTNLAEPATRELVAELIFRAIHPDVETVHYVPAEGDYAEEGSSLGEQVFDLVVKDSADEWGRPEVLWTYNTGDEETVIEIDPVATYTTAVAECDVYEDTGLSGKVNAYVNSNTASVDYFDIDELATKDTIGAQGQLVEVYAYTDVNGNDQKRIVVIDTFLAHVADVVSSETDGNGHLDRQALLKLDVYTTYGQNPQTVYLTSDTDYTYAEGDMLLVNAYTDNANSYSIAVAKQSVEGYVNQYDVAKHLEVAQAAESFVGAQTEDWVNAHKHVIDGEEYMDAFRFSLDETNNNVDNDETINYNWWLDQYGNIIGVTAMDRTGYAVLKDIIWTSGQAEATLVYMDGSEDTVIVDTIDGLYTTTGWNAVDAVPVLRDDGLNNDFNTATNPDRVQVSSDATNNTEYLGYALYQVYTNDDGTVKLEGQRTSGQLIDYTTQATINVNRSTISDSTGVVARFDGSTQFIVNNGDGTYSAYTRDTLPTFAEDSLEVFWSLDEGTDTTYASSVYIKSSVLSAENGTHLFAIEDASYRVVGTGIHVIEAVVDGQNRTIRTVEDDVINTLMENEGKLFHVTFDREPLDADGSVNETYGYVTDVDLVNEAHDSNSCTLDDSNPSTIDEVCNYTVSEKVDASASTIAIKDTNSDTIEESYNITNATTIVDLDGTTVNYNIETIEQAVENLEVGIWVVEDENGAAAQIYIGTRLTNNDDLNVISISDADATGNWSTTTPNTYEITIPYDADSCEVVVAAAAQNAVLVDSADNGYLNPGYEPAATRTLRFNTGLNKGGDSRTATVTVWAEDGVTHTEYTVKVTRAHMDTTTGILAKIYDKDNNAIVINDSEDLAKLTYYKSLEDAVNASASMNMDKTDTLNVTSLTPGAYSVTYASLSTTAEVTAAADRDFDSFKDVDASGINKYLVLKITMADGSAFNLADSCTANAVYIVFNTQA